jgi:hypothetical protein
VDKRNPSAIEGDSNDLQILNVTTGNLNGEIGDISLCIFASDI